MRAFIAIELSDTAKEHIVQTSSRLAYAGADVKWVKREAIHLTLKFLGDISEDKVRNVSKALDEIVSHTAPFEIAYGSVGAFPSSDHPRVIWIGIEHGACEIAQIAEHIETSLEKLGFSREARAFSPHSTIGRVRSPRNMKQLSEKISSVSLDMPRIPGHTVMSVILFKSTLTPHGSLYDKLHEAFFV